MATLDAHIVGRRRQVGLASLLSDDTEHQEIVQRRRTPDITNVKKMFITITRQSFKNNFSNCFMSLEYHDITWDDIESIVIKEMDERLGSDRLDNYNLTWHVIFDTDVIFQKLYAVLWERRSSLRGWRLSFMLQHIIAVEVEFRRRGSDVVAHIHTTTESRLLGLPSLPQLHHGFVISPFSTVTTLFITINRESLKQKFACCFTSFDSPHDISWDVVDSVVMSEIKARVGEQIDQYLCNWYPLFETATIFKKLVEVLWERRSNLRGWRMSFLLQNIARIELAFYLPGTELNMEVHDEETRTAARLRRQRQLALGPKLKKD